MQWLNFDRFVDLCRRPVKSGSIRLNLNKSPAAMIYSNPLFRDFQAGGNSRRRRLRGQMPSPALPGFVNHYGVEFVRAAEGLRAILPHQEGCLR
jgi:hypothetical protein